MRFLLKLVLCFLLALAAGFGYLALRSGDALYSVYEWLSPARFQQYDQIISSVAAEHRLDPMLVKAVAWRESRFDTHKVGTTGERGLMQVSAKAANEWAQQNESEPLAFALAEYNAGASRAQRWVGADGMTTNQFLANIEFPITRSYVQSIMKRYAFYKRRGRM